jgi:hypothetical protein
MTQKFNKGPTVGKKRGIRFIAAFVDHHVRLQRRTRALAEMLLECDLGNSLSSFRFL